MYRKNPQVPLPVGNKKKYMITNELLQFIKDQRSTGVSDASIKTTLVANNWAESDVDEAYKTLSIGIPVPNKEPINPVSTSQQIPQTKHTVSSWIMLVYAIVIVSSFLNLFSFLGGLVFPLLLIVGGVAAISFFSRLVGVAKNLKNVIAKVFTIVVGIGGGIAIFVISFIAALFGLCSHGGCGE